MSNHLGRLNVAATLPATIDFKQLSVVFDKADSHVVSFGLSGSHPPDMLIQAAALRVFHQELADSPGYCVIDGIEDSALARAVASGEHGETAGKLESALV